MFVSMTGFTQREFELGGRTCILQVKSYNNRYLDIAISLPSSIAGFEPRIQEIISSEVIRGKVECTIRFKGHSRANEIAIDIDAAKAAYAALSKISAACGLDEKPTLSQIAGIEGVFNTELDDNIEALWLNLEKELRASLEEYQARRRSEGSATARSILSELSRLEKGLAFIEGKSSVIGELIKTQMTSRFAELLSEPMDPARLLQEIAVHVVRYGINEEIVRLKAHFAAFAEISNQPSPSKKLDFLCQEMNREINTIGSKNILAEVAHMVVDMKDALENIREQLRNLE